MKRDEYINKKMNEAYATLIEDVSKGLINILDKGIEMTEQQEMWDKEVPKESISLDDMDNVVKKLRELKMDYDEKSIISKQAYAFYQEQQEQMISMLKAAGRDEYTVKGFGKVTIKDELSVQTPKSPDEKAAFFSWIKETMGEDAYYTYMTVNSRSLNSLYKEKVEEYGAKGEVLTVPGLAEPTSYTKLSLRKA